MDQKKNEDPAPSNSERPAEATEAVEVPRWIDLPTCAREDLHRHNITAEQWDSWPPDQRKQVVNFRARMAAAGLWSELDRVMFVKVNSDGRTTIATVEPEAWMNFLLAFTIKETADGEQGDFDDFRRKLDRAGIRRDRFCRHKEASWSHHEGGSGISLHILGLKPPSNGMCVAHFDAYGGNWWNPRHVFDAFRKAGPTQDEVTKWLCASSAAREHLREFRELDSSEANEGSNS